MGLEPSAAPWHTRLPGCLLLWAADTPSAVGLTGRRQRLPTRMVSPALGDSLCVGIAEGCMNRPGFAGECLVRLVVDGGGWSGRWLVGGGVDMRKRGVVAVAATRGTGTSRIDPRRYWETPCWPDG